MDVDSVEIISIQQTLCHTRPPFSNLVASGESPVSGSSRDQKIDLVLF